MTAPKLDQSEIQQQLLKTGLVQRDAQWQMIEAVFKAISGQKIACIEAPTGTGKTLAYLIGSLHAKNDKQKILISTATIALQEQLFNKDLPLLCKILRRQINYAIAKGRRRYVCHARLYNQEQQPDLLVDQATLTKLRSQLENRRWHGDRDKLDWIVRDEDWQKISTDSSGCSGKHCDYFEECAFFKARKQMHSTDIIVANHSLVLSDLELGGGMILPEQDKTVYIFDEAHHLPHKALDHFAKSCSILGAIDWINRLTRTLTRIVQADYMTNTQQDAIAEQTHALVGELKRMREFIEPNRKQFNDDIWQLEENDVTGELIEIGGSILIHARKVLTSISVLKDDLELKAETISSDKAQASELSTLIGALGFALSRAENCCDTWALFCHPRKPKEAPIARWFRDAGEYYHLHCAPINVSQTLQKLLWEKCQNGAILCSATLRALGKFDDFQRKVGLRSNPRYYELALNSFFDYQRSILFVPTMQHAPLGQDQSAHRQEVLALLPELLLPNTGTLVLFTSKKAMQDSFEQLPDTLTQDILMQGNQGKNKLIELHKKRIRLGKRSILFGLASFGEGLDLPADFCQHVIIHKLPFAVPSTPIEQTRSRWLEKNRLNPFQLATLPATSIRLTQYVGRLIRQESDTGIVTILDKRLYTKQYGAALIANLPQFTQLINQPVTALKDNDKVTHFFTDTNATVTT